MRNSSRFGMLIMYCAILQLLFSLKGEAQTGYAFAKHNVHLPKPAYINNVATTQSLYSILKELNQSKGVYFLFSDMGLGEIKVNTVWDNMASIETILDQVLQKTGLKYKKVSSNTFVILPVKKNSKDKRGLSSQPVSLADGSEQNLVIISEGAFDIITGKVTGSDNKPLAGVSVSVKGTSKGTLTNAAGEFSIEANRGDVLVFSSVGFESYEITVTDTHLPVTLRESQSQLNEVVVTALGIQRKS